jgi:hypothetical protein
VLSRLPERQRRRKSDLSSIRFSLLQLGLARTDMREVGAVPALPPPAEAYATKSKNP